MKNSFSSQPNSNLYGLTSIFVGVN